MDIYIDITCNSMEGHLSKVRDINMINEYQL